MPHNEVPEERYQVTQMEDGRPRQSLVLEDRNVSGPVTENTAYPDGSNGGNIEETRVLATL